jgi:hypothetical protein
VVPEEVPNPGEIVLGAYRFYEKRPDESLPVLQLSYPDAAGRFPWESRVAGDHPRLGDFQA